MAQHAAVTVVIPVLNEAPFICEALDSLLAQAYEPLEIVVYDGGSTDGTLQILNDYQVEVHVEPGLGQMAAINRGWRRSQADFVTWMAGDDRLRPGAFRQLASALQAHPEAAVVHADAAIIDGQGHQTGVLQPGNIQLRELIYEFTLVPQTTLIRRSALARAGMFDEARRLAADHDLFLRLAQYYPLHYVPFLAADYRMHAGSQDAQNLSAVADAVLDVNRRFFERPDLTPEQQSWWKRGMAAAYLFAGSTHCLAGDKQRAWGMWQNALHLSPRAVFATRRGVGLMIRMLSPVRIGPYQLRTLWQKPRRLLGRSASNPLDRTIP